MNSIHGTNVDVMFVRQMRGTREYGLVHEVNGTSASYRSAANIARLRAAISWLCAVCDGTRWTLLNVHRHQMKTGDCVAIHYSFPQQEKWPRRDDCVRDDVFVHSFFGPACAARAFTPPNAWCLSFSATISFVYMQFAE